MVASFFLESDMPPEETKSGETPEQKVETKVETTEVKDEPKVYTESHVKKIHAENANRRIENEQLKSKLAEFEREKADRERKDLEEQKRYQDLAAKEREAREKAEKDRDAAVALERREKVLAKAEALAVRKGIRDEAISDLALLDWSGVDADQLPAKIEDLVKSKPHWFAPAEKPVEKPEKKAATTTPSGPAVKTSGDDASSWDKAKLAREWGTVKL